MKKPFDEVFEDVTKYGTKLKTDEYHANGAYIIIDQGQEQIAGYTDSEEGLFTSVPALIFGDHTRVVKYVDMPFFLGADGVKVLRSRFADANYRYLYYALKSIRVPNTGYNRHFKWLKEAEIEYPNNTEQRSIVSILDRLSDIIDARKAELQKLDELIKARFVEMFGNPIDTSLNRIPLSEYVDSIRYGTSQPPEFDDKGSYKFIRATNIKYGRIVEKDMLRISEKEAKRINKCRLHTGELIIVRSGANTGDTCVLTNDYDGQYAGYDIIVSLKTDMLNPVFLNEMINIPEYMRTIVKPLTARSAQPHLNAQQVQSLPVVVADKERQNEFETFCKQVDKSKAAVQQALDKAQLLFDSLMQQYFG